MASQELIVEIKAKLDVDRQTAETCLGMAALYANNNGMKILGERGEDGRVQYWFEDRT